MQRLRRAGKGEVHQRDAVVCRVVKNARDLQRARLFPRRPLRPRNDGGDDEQHNDHRNRETNGFHRIATAQLCGGELVKDERGDEEIEVQLYDRAKVHAPLSVQQPARAEHDENRQEHLRKYSKNEHGAQRLTWCARLFQTARVTAAAIFPIHSGSGPFFGGLMPPLQTKAGAASCS